MWSISGAWQLANELEVPIICTCQFTEKLDINPFEWSGSLPTVIEQEASIVLKIEKDSETNNAQIIVEKSKYGDIGKVNATFDFKKQSFKEV